MLDERLIDFYVDLLGADGLFVVRQVGMNIGHLPAMYLVRAMCNVASDWHPSAPRLVLPSHHAYSALPTADPAEAKAIKIM